MGYKNRVLFTEPFICDNSKSRISPLVSIITPCYNAVETIIKTIDSVLYQTYQNWEMIIVDDCSSDASLLIIDDYAKKDSRIKYYKTEAPSGSPAIPRNIGIEKSHGQYIAFLDSDDIWLPSKLERQMSYVETSNCDLLYSYYEKINWDGHRNGRVIKPRKWVTYCNLLQTNVIPMLTAIVRRDVIGNVRFKQIAQEDYCFWLDIMKKGYKAECLQSVTALYRESKNSRSSNKIKTINGQWCVLRNHQNVPFIPSCFYMFTYAVAGMIKHFK